MRRPACLALLLAVTPACDASPVHDAAASETPPPTLPAGLAEGEAAVTAPPADEVAPEPTPPPERAWPAIDPPPAIEGDAITSKVRHLWIRPSPHNSKSWLGYLSLGDRVRVKGGDAEKAYAGPGTGSGCAKWYAVEPAGFVCVGEDATLDDDDPIAKALREDAADPSSPWPYRYGESLHVPVYKTLPSLEKQRQMEPGLDAHLEALAARRKGEKAKEGEKDPFAGVDLTPGPKRPPALLDLNGRGRTNKRYVHFGSTLAWVDRFEHEGRTFLMLWDRGFVPADKIKPYPELPFSGVAITDDLAQPIAWFRKHDGPRYQRTPDGGFQAGEATWKRLARVRLTGREERAGDLRFFETTEGDWCAADDVTVVRKATKLPRQLQKDPHRTWLDVSVLGGTMVAYEGSTPVYATLISPGRGGLPQVGVPTLDTASTPTGTFSVLGKFLTATMQSSSVKTLVHSEVQYTQNFDGPYSVHGAYWHDRFGEPKSGGCVNLAPIDAKRVFEWTRPRLPQGWHGMRTLVKGADWEPPTLVSIHR